MKGRVEHHQIGASRLEAVPVEVRDPPLDLLRRSLEQGERDRGERDEPALGELDRDHPFDRREARERRAQPARAGPELDDGACRLDPGAREGEVEIVEHPLPAEEDLGDLEAVVGLVLLPELELGFVGVLREGGAANERAPRGSVRDPRIVQAVEVDELASGEPHRQQA